jgi:hypothetical protein
VNVAGGGTRSGTLEYPRRQERTIDRRITVDAALTELRDINSRLERLALDDPARRTLESRKEELQTAARLAADRARDPAALERELDQLRGRLDEIDERPIDRSWAQKGDYRWINDPGAYSNVINQKIAEGDAAEREAITERIGELETALQESARDRSIENG